MKLNKKGMTLVEIIVSVVLISIVLIFLMTLFLKVLSTYKQSKVQSDYHMITSNIINAVGSDIEKYGLESIQYVDEEQKDSLLFTFKTFRNTKLSQPIRKVLKVYFQNNKYFISYAYDSNYTPIVTSAERTSNVIKVLPDDVILDGSKYIQMDYETFSDKVIYDIKIPISTADGNIYDINIYGAGTSKGSPFIVTNDQYYFNYNKSTGTFISNNQNAHSSTAKTTITVLKDLPVFEINWFVDSEAGHDYLSVLYNGTTIIDKKSGLSQSGSYTINNIRAGSKIIIVYSKDGSVNKGADYGRLTINYDMYNIRDDTYGFTYNHDAKTFISNNQGVQSSIAKTTITFKSTVPLLNIDWFVDSQTNCDKLSISYKGSTIVSNKSGTNQNGTYTIHNVTAGSQLVLTYIKDGSIDENTDQAIVTLN